MKVNPFCLLQKVKSNIYTNYRFMKNVTTHNVVLVLAILALVVASYSFGKYQGEESQDLQEIFVQDTAEDAALDAEIEAEEAGATTVTVTEDGFQPSSVTVKVGQKVVWVNTSGDDVVPVYTPFKLEESIGLEGDTVDDSDNWEVGFTQVGTYEYYDELHPERKGTVIVVE